MPTGVANGCCQQVVKDLSTGCQRVVSERQRERGFKKSSGDLRARNALSTKLPTDFRQKFSPNHTRFGRRGLEAPPSGAWNLSGRLFWRRLGQTFGKPPEIRSGDV